MTTPIPVKVTRYGCPHCGRTASRPVRTREHIARCWRNPDARGCKTCAHFQPGLPGEADTGYPGEIEHCTAGIDLAGRPACTTCNGRGETFDLDTLGASECADCGGDGAEVKPGPLVHCHAWEAAEVPA